MPGTLNNRCQRDNNLNLVRSSKQTHIHTHTDTHTHITHAFLQCKDNNISDGMMHFDNNPPLTFSSDSFLIQVVHRFTVRIKSKQCLHHAKKYHCSTCAGIAHTHTHTLTHTHTHTTHTYHTYLCFQRN